MKRTALIVLLLSLMAMAFAGIDEYYNFSASTSTYTPITGTQVDGINTDDALSAAVPIGFTFTYGDLSFTEVKVSSNGWVGLGTSATSSNLGNDLANTSYTPFLGVLWDDTSLASGSASYLTSGTAPNRTFTVQYDNLKWNYSGDNSFNFQLVLHESGMIRMNYGSSTGTPNSPSASIGITMAPGGNGWFYSVTPGNPASASTTVAQNSISAFPVQNTRYEFTPAIVSTNDLACLSITGSLTPSVDTAANYTIQVKNRGTAPQSVYSVKIVNLAGTELASIPGTTIQPNATLSFSVPWTPTLQGPMTIRGKVVLAGDQNATNDLSPALSITIMPPGINVITIGTGDQQALMPVNMYYRNSLYETLYYPNEIGTVGIINTLGFYNNFVTNLPNMPTKIWLGMTPNADLSGGWIPSTQLTLVYDGTVNYPSGQNAIVIPLQTTFTYTGGNLVMLVNRPMDTVYYNWQDNFYCQTVGTNRALSYYSDGTLLDPASPPATSAIGQFPKTSLYMTPLSPNPLFMAVPASQNFGQVLMGTTHNVQMRVLNAGGGTLTINSLSIAGSQFFTLSGVPTLPQNLTTGQSVSFTLNYIPTTDGDHAATITAVDNLTRQTHTIAVTGSCMDPTIYTVPYAQNFDTVTVPSLPLDWTAIVQSTSPTAYVRSTGNTSASAPNSVEMQNADDTAPTLLLIAPPLATNLQTTGMRIKVQARSSSATTLIVGVMTNSQDPATFTAVQTLNLTQTWTQYVVSLSSYAGTGRYIAFKSGADITYCPIDIDSYLIEVTPVNDLAATTITGNVTPSVNSATPYTVSVFNWGTATQTNYQVKLFNSLGTELASGPGLTVNAGQTVQVPVTWTPVAEGPLTIYAKTVLTGDENSLNDQSPNLVITVMPAGLMVMTIGDGSQNARLPIDMFWRNSLFETLYYPQEMGAFGNINAVTFYNNFSTNLPDKPTKIWLGSTQNEDLSAGWIPSTQLTLVFDGTVTYPTGPNTITIPLQTPYAYTGGNLVLMANRPMDTTYFSSSDYFLCQTVGTNRARNIYSDSTVFDPTAPPDGATLSGQFPKTTFFLTALSPDPMFMINPSTQNYGTVLMNTTHSRQFTVTNVGGGPLTINSMAYSGSNMINLTGAPTIPITLNTGQNFSFTATYLPTAVGTHTGTITFNDNMAATREGGFGSSRAANNRQVHTVNLTGTCIDPTITTLPYVENFDTVTTPALPITWSMINQSTSSSTIATTTANPYSPSNCVVMSSTSDGGSTQLLITPPLQSTTALNTMRVKFFANGSAGHTLQVGIMTNPQDAATFVQLGTATLTTGWTEYVISFTSYTGAGHYVAFKHGGGTYQTVYIDNVMLEVTPQNDLSPLNLTGNLTPSVGSATVYTVNVFNWGTNPQATYTVKLFKTPEVELASVAGLTVAPNQSVSVPISWTPDVEGAVTLFARTILASDQNSINNQSPNYPVVVQPQGLVTITIGDGSQEARMPVDFYWKNSLFETMYYPTELSNTIGIFYGVNFYNNFPSELASMPTKIWLGTTTQPDLSGGWIPSTQLQLVFDGTVTYPAGENTIHISFTTPYMYLTGGNLVMMVNRPMDTQYYSSLSYFKCQTVGESRTMNIYSDSETFDPAAPADGTNSGQFPTTTFFIIPGGVGHVNGTVLGAGNQPLSDVNVSFNTGGYHATTDAQGHYGIQNIIADDYVVTFSHYGYITQTQNITLAEDQTLTLNVTMVPMPVVNVTGTILASDTTLGLSGASIHLTGYQNYTVNTTATGAFTIPSVYANQAYSYSITCPGYTSTSGNITVGASNYVIPPITLLEVAYAPSNVTAALNPNGTEALIDWTAPDPNAVEVTEGFEGTGFPPDFWTQTITNTGAANTSGVFPTWCSFGPAVVGTATISPTEGTRQGGLWWSYEHQDEWLITPGFNCPPTAYLSFDSYVFLGSTAGDHYYIKVSTDNGVTWATLWDASAQTGGWNSYASPIVVDLAPYGGQQIKLAWHAIDPPSNDGLWYVWFIDDIYIGNAVQNVRFAVNSLERRSASIGTHQFTSPIATTNRSRFMENGSPRSELSLPHPQYIKQNAQSSRFLTGYKVWRLVSGQETNQNTWTELTPEPISAIHYTDTGWNNLPDNVYRWAVKAVYTNGVLSVPSFSNTIISITETGMISGVVRQQNNQPIPGAVVTAGTYSATTNNSGAYSIIAETGTYTVHVSAANFSGQTVENVLVVANQTTTVNFVLIPGSDSDDPTAPVVATALNGNYPNPFNPSTTISYAVKDPAEVKIAIYNLKGQLVRTLVSEYRNSGRYTAIWNGKDDHNRPVASGVYYYRMSAGTYHSTRKMLLVE